MKRKLLILLIIILTGIPGIFSKDDPKLIKYINKDPWFTFEYPEEFEKQPLQYSTEVVRLAAKNMYKIPVMVAHVSKNKKKLHKDIVLENFITRIKSKAPDSSGFKIILQKKVKLNDGSEALLLGIKWTWINGAVSIPMDTIIVTTHKENEEITLSGVYTSDLNLLNEITYLCMTLNIDKDKN